VVIGGSKLSESEALRKVVLLTGATGAIGYAIARQIASLPGYELVITSRRAEGARKSAERLSYETGNAHIRPMAVDLADKENIYNLAASWIGPLNVLINNAVNSPPARQETPEGIEVQFATNVLGYFWMSEAFTPHLTRSAPARIVNVASGYAGHLELDDLEFKRRRYDNQIAYQQSKQANRMLTAAFAERLKDRGVTVNACYPGYVRSQLTRDLRAGGTDSPEEGARTPVWLATAEEAALFTGTYFSHRQPVHDHFTDDREAVEALYQICAGY
jgi:NAD(P)-dependent dehydrogenase (short-subunit alcohol dehydrogenase family)